MSRGSISGAAGGGSLGSKGVSAKALRQLKELRGASGGARAGGSGQPGSPSPLDNFLQALANQGNAGAGSAFLSAFGLSNPSTTGGSAFGLKGAAKDVAAALRTQEKRKREREDLELEILKKQLLGGDKKKTTGGNFGPGPNAGKSTGVTVGQIREDERRRSADLRDLAKAEAIRTNSQAKNLGTRIKLLKQLLAGGLNGSTDTTISEQIFNNAGGAQVIPLKTTSSNNSAILQQLLRILG